jgi:ketosteroid isomerase-like protein
MDVEHERRQLLQRDAEWAALSSKGHEVDRILAFWTDDALVYPPGMHVLKGKTALRAYVEGALAIPGFHIPWTTSEAILSPDGRFAYLLSANTVTAPGPGGQLETTQGRAVTVWRREPDGEWRCAVDIWNHSPPAPEGRRERRPLATEPAHDQSYGRGRRAAPCFAHGPDHGWACPLHAVR